MGVVVSIKGKIDSGITCATGAVAFIPLGLLVNVIGIPLLLVSFQKKFREPRNLRRRNLIFLDKSDVGDATSAG